MLGGSTYSGFLSPGSSLIRGPLAPYWPLSIPGEGGDSSLLGELGGNSVNQFLPGPHRRWNPVSPAHLNWQWTWSSSVLCWSRCLCPGVWVWFRGVLASFVAAELTHVLQIKFTSNTIDVLISICLNYASISPLVPNSGRGTQWFNYWPTKPQ